MDEDDYPAGELIARAPTEQDVVELCARLNEFGAKHVVSRGFAIITSG